MALTLRNGIWHWRKMVEGHTFARSTKTGDKKLAQQMVSQWESEAIREVVLKGTKPVLLHGVIQAFLDAREGTGGQANARVHLKHFLALPNVRLNELSLTQLQGVIAKRRALGAAHNTLVVTISYWNAVVKFAEERRWTTGVKLPRLQPQKTRIRYLTHVEEAALFAAIDPTASYRGKCARSDAARQDNSDLLVALLNMGCRYREAARMIWSQVDLEGRRVLVIRGKGGVNSTLVMSEKLHSMFARRKSAAVDQWVFPTKRRHNNNFGWMKAALARAGIAEDAGKVTLHTCRHTAATRWLKGGLNLQEVQQMLGHKHYGSTLIYAHIEAGAVAGRAAEILNCQQIGAD